MNDMEEIYDLYFDDVFRYILRLSGNRHIAEDITSETFFKAMESLRYFRGECSIRVWLCQIAKNCYFNYSKKASRSVAMDDTALVETEDGAASVEEQLIKREQAEKLQAILHTLPEPYREVFMWRVYAELSYRQIGAIFGKSDNWACVTYHRARNEIKKTWEDGTYET